MIESRSANGQTGPVTPQTKSSYETPAIEDLGTIAELTEANAPRVLADVNLPAGSPLTPEDFAAYRASWVEPIATTYRGFEVVEMPPSTQGFATLQILNLLEGFDVAAWGALS